MANKRSVSESENELVKLQFEVWKTAVETQMHFNDLMIKTRQLFLSVIAALLATSLYLAKENDVKFFINIQWIGPRHISFYLICLVILVLVCLWTAETKTLLPLLRGAVKFGEDIENTVITKKITNTQQGMTQLISLYSKHKHVARHEARHNELITYTHIPASKKISLSTKINIGYGALLVILIIWAFMMWNIVK